MEIYTFLNSLGKGHIKEVLNENLPTKFISDHLTISSKIYNRLINLIILNGYYFKKIIYFSKLKKQRIINKYDILVYIPNKKYERFYNRLFSKCKLKILLLSNDENVMNSITSNYPINSNIKHFIHVILKSYLFCTRICLLSFFKKKYLVNKTELIHMMSSVYQSYFLVYLKNNVEFKKIFSMHPNGDMHFLLRKVFFGCKFYSMRPDTTTYSREHKHITTDYLFYKSEYERKVYEDLKIKTSLIKGGMIYDKIIKPRKSFNNKPKILFIDTCTNKLGESLKIRRNAIDHFYDGYKIGGFDYDLYHKFHPGLIKKEQQKSIYKLESLGIKIIDDDLNICDYDIVVGFYSTMFHDILLNGICFVEITGDYNMYPLIENSLVKSPIPKIKSKRDIIKFFNKAESNIDFFYDLSIWKWYYSFYNIPKGKNDILSNLT